MPGFKTDWEKSLPADRAIIVRFCTISPPYWPPNCHDGHLLTRIKAMKIQLHMLKLAADMHILLTFNKICYIFTTTDDSMSKYDESL